MWLNEAEHIWHIDRVTEQWQNLEQVSIWFSASVPDHKAIWYPLLSILYLCAISVSAVCYLERSFLLCCCECSVLFLWEYLLSVWCFDVCCCVWRSCCINPIVLLYILPYNIYCILLFVILSSVEKNKAKRIVRDSPSLFILSVLCVVVSISGQLYLCIFSCDPLLFLSGVLCPSPQAIGALLFLYDVWWDGQKLINFLYSGGHRLEYCLLCCVFSCCVVLSPTVCSGSVWSART